MISIEKVSNGFVARVEEDDEDYTVVFQKEFNSLNVALGAVLKMVLDKWSEDEPVKVTLDVGPK